ncbi:MAG: GNAT family N-acetyltransferase [Bacteroidetes bacterium]|nr:GNAT family N-acetyltransferase [Bacteroidota bacterium]
MITIRPAQKEDFKTVYDFINLLENDHFQETNQQLIFERNLENNSILYLVAFVGSEPAGFISCHAQWLLHHSALIGEIQEMIVAEKFRSQGIGKLLMAELIQYAQRRGIVQLEVTSSKKRKEAHRFYTREGFVESHFKFTRNL